MNVQDSKGRGGRGGRGRPRGGGRYSSPASPSADVTPGVLWRGAGCDVGTLPPTLLTDAQMQEFIRAGYLVLRSAHLPSEFHQHIFQQAKSACITDEENPGNNILPRMPSLRLVFEDPSVRGALTSILGQNYMMHPHRHCHESLPGRQPQLWHKDSYFGGHKQRHHRPRWVMAMYYPQKTPLVVGPTSIIPCSQYYGEKERQHRRFSEPPPEWFLEGKDLACDAGTVVLIHYDIWHRGSANRSEDKLRFMFKFQFVRTEEPVVPTWNFASSRWLAPSSDPSDSSDVSCSSSSSSFWPSSSTATDRPASTSKVIRKQRNGRITGKQQTPSTDTSPSSTVVSSPASASSSCSSSSSSSLIANNAVNGMNDEQLQALIDKHFGGDPLKLFNSKGGIMKLTGMWASDILNGVKDTTADKAAFNHLKQQVQQEAEQRAKRYVATCLKQRRDRNLMPVWLDVWRWLCGRAYKEGGQKEEEAEKEKETEKATPETTESASQLLQDLLSGRDDPTCLRAAYLLGSSYMNSSYKNNSHDQQLCEQVADALRQKQELFVQRNAAYAFIASINGADDPSSSLSALMNLLAPNKRLSQGALAHAIFSLGEVLPSLSFILQSKSVDLLLHHIDAPEFAPRANVAEALGNLSYLMKEQNEKAQSALIERCVNALKKLVAEDPEPQVRHTACLALLRWRHPSAVEVLQRAATMDQDRYVVGYALEALCRLVEVRPDLISSLMDLLFASRWCPFTTARSQF